MAALSLQPAFAASDVIDYTFKGGSDGFYPNGGMAAIKGTLYGTTKFGGGSTGCGDTQGYIPGCGTVFSLTRKGVEKILHVFSLTDGSWPVAGLVNVGGVFYGTTLAGGTGTSCGSLGCGTVFSVTRKGVFKVLHNFTSGQDGSTPYAGLVNVGGVLYGTTQAGGLYSYGTVFSITPAGNESVIYSFKGNGDGRSPNAPLVNVGGLLYGTTKNGGIYGTSGGAAGFGTAFSITTAGAETVLHSFGLNTDGTDPFGALVDVGGMLYGTTYSGGAYGYGAVYSLTHSGAESLLYSLGSGNDGLYGVGALLNMSGLLYGTTQEGGTAGHGTVFNITTVGAENVVHSFLGGSDGAAPYNDSMTNVSGVLHGATAYGGLANAPCGTSGCGTVFHLTP